MGKRGIFSTIRVLGKKPKFILIDYHIKNMNIALKKMNINFYISEKLILDFLQPAFNKLNNKVKSTVKTAKMVLLLVAAFAIANSIKPQEKEGKEWIKKLSSLF